MNIPAFVINIFLIGFLLFAFRKWYVHPNEKTVFVISGFLKITAGLLLGYIYLNHFEGSDTRLYYEEATKIAEYASETRQSVFDILFSNSENGIHPQSSFSGQPRAIFFTKIVYLFYWITGGSFWLISVYFSLVSFLALWMLYQQLVVQNLVGRMTAMISLLLWPSVVFWSSGILKESISMACIALMCFVVITISNRTRINFAHILIYLAASYFLFKVKYYYAGILIPMQLSYLTIFFLKERTTYLNAKTVSAVAFLCLFGGIVLLTSQLHYNLRLSNIGEVIVNNYHLFEQKSDPGKMVHFEHLRPDVLSFVKYSPKAWFAGWFRPFVFDIENAWSLIAAIENTMLFLLFIFQLKNVKKLWSNDGNLRIAILLFCLLMGIFLTYSAPNFGTLVRYKVGFLPFLLLLILERNPVLGWMRGKGRQ